MFWCPTSELPICPSGRPTASPEDLIAVCGHSRASLSMLGVRARAMALPSLRGLMPHPSIIISTNGRGRAAGVVLILSTFQREAAGYGGHPCDGRFRLRVDVLQHAQEHPPVQRVRCPIVPAPGAPGRGGERLQRVPGLSPARVQLFPPALLLCY